MTLIFATSNEHKVGEIRRILPDGIRIRSLADIGFEKELPETQPTIEGNSLQKASELQRLTGLDCFAEDTGLEVTALGGEPGVRSARYAGPGKAAEDNMALLLRNLEGEQDRSARFKTVITLIVGDRSHQFEGVLEGTIGTERRGSGGFGYDPVFVLPDGRSLAECTPDEKAVISHRAKATKRFIEFLQKGYIR